MIFFLGGGTKKSRTDFPESLSYFHPNAFKLTINRKPQHHRCDHSFLLQSSVEAQPSGGAEVYDTGQM